MGPLESELTALSKCRNMAFLCQVVQQEALVRAVDLYAGDAGTEDATSSARDHAKQVNYAALKYFI